METDDSGGAVEIAGDSGSRDDGSGDGQHSDSWGRPRLLCTSPHSSTSFAGTLFFLSPQFSARVLPFFSARLVSFVGRLRIVTLLFLVFFSLFRGSLGAWPGYYSIFQSALSFIRKLRAKLSSIFSNLKNDI